MAIDPIAAGGYVGMGIAAVMAAYERMRSQKALEGAGVEKAKDELADVLRAEIVAQKQRYETEHAEYVSYRERTHDNNNKYNAQILGLSNENTILQSKTDITPVLSFTKEQVEFNGQVLEGLKEIVMELKDLRMSLKS